MPALLRYAISARVAGLGPPVAHRAASREVRKPGYGALEVDPALGCFQFGDCSWSGSVVCVCLGERRQLCLCPGSREQDVTIGVGR